MKVVYAGIESSLCSDVLRRLSHITAVKLCCLVSLMNHVSSLDVRVLDLRHTNNPGVCM